MNESKNGKDKNNEEKKLEKDKPKEQLVETQHSINLNGEEISYTAE